MEKMKKFNKGDQVIIGKHDKPLVVIEYLPSGDYRLSDGKDGEYIIPEGYLSEYQNIIMKTLAEKIADIVYPICGKSSERLNRDLVQQITPVIEEEFRKLIDTKA
jgi:hypothetical protein